jgi:2-oxoglutarate dehydrogenase E2 component (dihydrolipoamide succinyltransferase)
MKIEVKIPAVGESVHEAVLVEWYKHDGDLVHKDELLFLIETDKVTLEVSSEADGVLEIQVREGETVPVGAVVGLLDTEAGPGQAGKRERKEEKPREEQKPAAVAAPLSPPPAEAAVEGMPTGKEELPPEEVLPPSVRRLIAEENLDVSKIKGTGPGGRITKGDVLSYMERSGERRGPEEARPQARETLRPAPAPERAQRPAEPAAEAPRAKTEEVPSLREEERPEYPEESSRKPMSRIRLRIAERLLEARQNTAMLTTFNEIDMSRVQQVRARHKESFRERYGVSLGLMSFFIKACVAALKEFPEVNAFIDGKDMVYHHYYHIGVAIGSERGLVVPVIRHADRLGFAGLEQAIVDYSKMVRENRLDLSSLEGGTFTISNGGVYGSLLSTPILNTPQSAILGMHKIEDRPIALNGQVVIRPMMYVALSYDHRIIDGREAVTFLRRIKEFIENPERMMLEI